MPFFSSSKTTRIMPAFSVTSHAIRDSKFWWPETGGEALSLVREYHPTAISLDVFLPDMLGWTVLNHLKQDLKTRHIPIQILTLDDDRHHGLARGAFAFITKPTSAEELDAALTRIQNYSKRSRKRLLVVEDNPTEQTAHPCAARTRRHRY